MFNTSNRIAIRCSMAGAASLASATFVVAAIGTPIAKSPPTGPVIDRPHEVSESRRSSNVPLWSQAASITLDEVRSGELLWRVGGTLVPMPVVQTDVSLNVVGVVTHGKLVQRFENRATQVIEAIYVFPLPERAAVHRMEIHVGDRRIVSVVQERKEARRTYKRAKSEGKKAALVEQERPNLFTTSIANINPGESVDVVLEYIEEVEYRDGAYSLAFPLTFTPRYTPEAFLHVEESTGQATLVSSVVPDADRVTSPFQEAASPGAQRARFEVTIDMGMPLESIRSASHRIRVRQQGTKWFAEPEESNVLADRDLLLAWRPAVETAPEITLVTERFEDEGYALCLFMPPEQAPHGAGLPTETVFVIDVSSSMGGPSIRQARQALAAAIGRLRPTDRFNIVRFNEEYALFSRKFEIASSAVRAEAQDWVRRLSATGGTRIYPALERALRFFEPSESGVVQRIVFLTDGAVANEAQVLQRISAGVGSVRLHCVGIGPAPNRYLMRKMATNGKGLCEFIGSVSEAENRIDRVFEKLARPVMSDLEIRWLGPGSVEAHPARLPDLHAGDPLVVALRLPKGHPSGRVEVRGRTHNGPVTMTLEVDARARRGAGIATRWARHKVASLMDALHSGADSSSVREAVVDVARKHQLVTRYTSLVAVEDVVTAAGPASATRVANTLPHGSQLLRIGLPQGGTDLPLRRLLSWVVTLLGLTCVSVAVRPRSRACARVPRNATR